MKTYRFGIDQVYPTDCTLYITDGKISKTFAINSESWKMVSVLCLFIPSEEIDDNHDSASIARHLLYSDTTQDEYPVKEDSITTYIVGVASFYSNEIYPIRHISVVKVDCKFGGNLGEKEATVRAVSKVFRSKLADIYGMDGWTYEKLKKTELEALRGHYYKIGLGITMPEKLDGFVKTG